MRRSWLRLFCAGLIGLGLAIGYFVSSGPGERLLHQEIETQLSRLLDGKVEIGEVDLRLDKGLRIEAREVEAYPAADPSDPPALRARRIIAWLDPIALLVGRLELSTLILETPFLRVEQDASGAFNRLPLPALEIGPIDVPAEEFAEALIARIDGLDDTATRFFETLETADRVEIQDGTVLWKQQTRADSSLPPREIRLEFVTTVIERNWLSEELGLTWSSVIVDGQHAPFPFEASLEKNEAGVFDWNLEISKIPLGTAQGFIPLFASIRDLKGELSTEIRLIGEPEKPRRLRIDATLANGSFRFTESRERINRDKLSITANLEFSKNRVRLTQGHIEGDQLGIDMKGSVRRPLRPHSAARIESRMLGVELEDIFALARSFEEESLTARSLSRFVKPVEGGRILFIEVGGTASLSEWDALLSGRVRQLPNGFVFGGAFEGIRVASETGDDIESLQGEVEWVGDRLTLRNTTALYRGSPLPRVDVVLEGVSHLAQTPDLSFTGSPEPPPIPGLDPLLELIKPRDPDSLPPVKAIGLAIDSLVHPLLRWPLRDLRLLVEPLRSGMDLRIRSGQWGQASVEGELTWFGAGDAATVTAQLTLGQGRAAPALGASASPTVPTTRWGAGQFELEFRPRPQLPFQRAKGFFRLDGTKLIGNDVVFDIEPQGKLAARMVFDMAVAEHVGVDFSFALTDGALEHLNEFMALPPSLATGRFAATGSLRGTASPDEPLIRRLDGSVRAEAHNGVVRIEVPLLLRLAKASEGYNPLADIDELSFESLTSTIQFDQGALLFPDFSIEGPVRFYANGRIDPLMKPALCRGVVGMFLFRAPNQVLETIPLVKYFLPGSKRGLVGAYFKVKGPLAEPSVDNLPVATLMTLVPSAIKAPFKVLQYLFDPSGEEP